MKSMRLRDYKTLSVNREEYRSLEEIEKVVRAVYESIPSSYVYEREGKAPVRLYKYTIKDDADLTIRNITYQIWQDTEKVDGKDVPKTITPFNSFSELARSNARSGNIGTKEELWKKFRTDPATSPIYMRFNSYMYRNGYSAKNYWMNNVELDTDRSTTYATCDLPLRQDLKSVSKKSKRWKERVRFDSLEIIFDRSSGEFTANLTQ